MRGRKRCVLEHLEATLGRRKLSRERAFVLVCKGVAQLIAIQTFGMPPAFRRAVDKGYVER